MTIDEQYMWRCIQLAQLGRIGTSPNPMVGSVLVYQNSIIGEGYHRQFGSHHAEVNCLASVKPIHQHLIAASTLYVSLEPCSHTGKTPPCTQLIISSGIKKLVIGCIDKNDLVNGEGVRQLINAGIAVTVGILEKECIVLNDAFFYHKKNKTPYITLKWAQSSDFFMNDSSTNRTFITNEYANSVVHQLRACNDAILIGSGTLRIDNPLLTNRHFGTKQPVKVVIDRKLQHFSTQAALAMQGRVIVLNTQKTMIENNIHYLQCAENNFFQTALAQLYANGIGTLLVEGGATLLQLLINHNFYQKIVVFTNKNLVLNEGLIAPTGWEASLSNSLTINNNTINTYTT